MNIILFMENEYTPYLLLFGGGSGGGFGGGGVDCLPSICFST